MAVGGLALSLGPICALGSSLTWAIASTAYSRLSLQYPPIIVNFFRAAIALPLFIVGLFFSTVSLEQWAQVSFTSAGWLAISVLCSHAFGDVLFLWSTHYIGIPGALAISATYPLGSALAAWLFSGEVLTLQKITGLFLVVSGTVLVIIIGAGQLKNFSKSTHCTVTRRGYFFGVFLAVCTAILWALNSFSISVGAQGLPLEIVNILRMSFSVCLCPLTATLILRNKFKLIPFSKVRPILWIFALEGFGGSLMYAYSLMHSPLAIASALSSLAPVFAIPLALITKQEPFSVSKISSILIVVLGIWLLLAR